MVVLGGLLWLWRTVDENRKKASIRHFGRVLLSTALMEESVLFFPFG